MKKLISMLRRIVKAAGAFAREFIEVIKALLPPWFSKPSLRHRFYYGGLVMGLIALFLAELVLDLFASRNLSNAPLEFFRGMAWSAFVGIFVASAINTMMKVELSENLTIQQRRLFALQSLRAGDLQNVAMVLEELTISDIDEWTFAEVAGHKDCIDLDQARFDRIRDVLRTLIQETI